VRQLFKILQFGIVSGVGLAIDFAIFFLLIAVGLSPFEANAASGSCAVTFVYFASVRRIFTYKGDFLLGLFFAYLLFQAAGVTAASLVVGALAEHQVNPALAKILILPVTFSANYLFMSFLTRKGKAGKFAACPNPLPGKIIDRDR
jgi:putative flippase GtrA